MDIEIKRIKVKDLAPNNGQVDGLPKNPRFIKDDKFKKLVASLREDPEMMSLREVIAYDNHGELVVICGNMRFRAAKELKLADVPCKVLPSETPIAKLKAYTIKDNASFGENDWDALANEWDLADLDAWGVDMPDFGDTDSEKEEDTSLKKREKKNDFYETMLGDRLYNSDNEYDIPLLLMERQPNKGLLLPFSGWGTDTRAKKSISTYHFYVEDYRFEAIWKDPIVVLGSGCTEIVEPNLSLFDTTPLAYGLHLIYKKRWIARYWQECGVKIYADLNVAKKFQRYNVMGIPKGYNAFATRGYADRIEYLIEEINIAKEISGKDNPNMIVYGGGEKVKELCKEYSVLFVEQFMNNRKKKM